MASTINTHTHCVLLSSSQLIFSCKQFVFIVSSSVASSLPPTIVYSNTIIDFVHSQLRTVVLLLIITTDNTVLFFGWFACLVLSCIPPIFSIWNGGKMMAFVVWFIISFTTLSRWKWLLKWVFHLSEMLITLTTNCFFYVKLCAD